MMELTPRMWCTDYFADTRGQDDCKGDPGAAAVQNNKIVGLYSFTIENCAIRPNIPAVYTDIRRVQQWLKSRIADKSIYYIS